MPQQTLFRIQLERTFKQKRSVFIMEQARKPIRYEVDAETGEVLGEIYEGDKIVRANETAEESKKIYLNSERRFVKVYENVLKAKGEAQDKLTDREVAVLIALADFVCYNSCCLREGGHGNGKVLTQADLAERLGMKYNNFNAVFCSLRNKKALGTFRTGGVETITINPYIIMRGKQVNATVADYFKESVWAKLPS